MANFDTIKTAIDANIKTNGTQDITGGKMNSILKQMVDATDEQLTELESETNIKITKSESDIIKRTYKAEYDVNDFEDELMINANGQIESNAYFRVLRNLFVSEGDVIETIGVVSDNAVACCIAAYDANGNFLSDKSIFKDTSNSKKYVVSEGVAYLAIGTLLRIEDVKVSIPTAITFETLKKDIAKLESEIGLIFDSEYTIDDFEDYLMVDLQGNIVSNDYIRVLKNVPVSEGDVVETTGVVIDNAVACCIAAYDANGNFLSDKSIFKDTSNSKKYVVSEGVAYLSFSTLLRIENVNVAVNKSTALTTLRDEIKILSSGLNGLKVLNYEDFTEKEIFIESSGKEVFNAEYITTDFILIYGIKALSVVAAMGNKYGGGIAFYDRRRNYISSLYGKTTTEIAEYMVHLEDVPSEAWYIKVQGRRNYENISVSYHVAPNAETNAILSTIGGIGGQEKELYTAKADSMAADDYLIVEDTPNIRNSYVIQASSVIVGAMGKIRLSKGRKAYAAGIVEVDGTNVYEYNPNSPTAYNTFEHGLNISDFFRLTIKVDAMPMTAVITGKATLILESVGGRYEKEIMWNGGSEEVIFINQSATLGETEVTLSIKGKDVWYFGDSYLDFWTPYAYELGANNILIDGFSGRNSAQAWVSLKDELLSNTPKKIIWGMGMNDGDSSDAVSAEWEYYYKQLIAICEKLGIEPILVTIPNTPKVNNYYKNQIIKESGFRYVDIAKAMGAESKDSSWYNGLLSGDEVHPTNLGAKIIASHIIAQFAEIVA